MCVCVVWAVSNVGLSHVGQPRPDRASPRAACSRVVALVVLLRASRACVRSYKGMRPLSGCPGAWAKARSGRSARACDAREAPRR